MVRWFITPTIVTDIPIEEGGGVRRTPRLCYKDKYPCTQWGAVFFDEKRAALVRFETAIERTTFDQTDFTEELVSAEQWAALYAAYPELKNRWSDQP